MPTKRISIELKSDGEGTLKCHGLGEYPCLGSPTMEYPADITNTGVEGEEKFQEKYSNEYDVMMPWAILLGWERGLFIHEGADNLTDNGGPSAGCVHLASPNAKTVYDWVDGRTRITTERESK